MLPNVVELTKAFVEIQSVSQWSNKPMSDRVQTLIEAQGGWQVERTHYIDENGEMKINLIAKLGEGTGGLAFCSHNDTVPGQEQDWPAFTPEIKGDQLFGRGSCDMKGPLAATMHAAFSADPSALKKPIYLIVTADEELGLIGAKILAEESALLRNSKPDYGVIAEPTSMIPVYSHKGYGGIIVTALGKAAHSSTGLGVSANLLIAPFLAEIAELDKQIQTDESFLNHEYSPPHHTLNLTIDDGNCAANVTCPKTVVNISARSMPNSRSEELSDMIVSMAERYGFETEARFGEALYCSPTSDLIQTCVELTERQPETVSYGTDGMFLREHINELVILGPGDIAVAHTTAEFVPIPELHQAVDIYKQLIARLCM